jgi:hypothetical protein
MLIATKSGEKRANKKSWVLFGDTKAKKVGAAIL